MSVPARKRDLDSILALALLLWLGAALAVGWAGLLRDAPAPMIPVVIGTLSLTMFFVCWWLSPINEWFRQVGIKWLVLPHVSRFIGIYFLFLAQRGEIPRAWAVPAGIGDIVVALGALALFWNGASRPSLVLLWNTVGFADILFVAGNALRIGLQDWSSMAFLRQLPLSLLPTFVVPLIIATHLLIFARRGKRGHFRIDLL